MPDRLNRMLLAALCIVSLVVWWTALRATFGLALSNDAYTHILLALPVSAALIYVDGVRAHGQPEGARSGSVFGWGLLLVALGIGGAARFGLIKAQEDVRLAINMLALVLWLMASVLACRGTAVFRRFLFPLCLLLLMVPLPEVALGQIVEFLQTQSAVTARILFGLIGVPATQDGIMVSIPGLDIEVARECSSIRSSLMLVVTTMVLAHLFLHSWWRKGLLIACVIPLSVAKNGLRIVTIAELGTRVDRGFLTGRLHHNGGIVFFAIAVVVAAVFLLVLRKNEIVAGGVQRA